MNIRNQNLCLLESTLSGAYLLMTLALLCHSSTLTQLILLKRRQMRNFSCSETTRFLFDCKIISNLHTKGTTVMQFLGAASTPSVPLDIVVSQPLKSL